MPAHLGTRWREATVAAIPATLPAQIGCLGREVVRLIKPWADCGRAAATDSTVLRAAGSVWHKKDREAGVVPHTSIDTEAHWTKSGWHGWVYGWKLHLVTTVASVWIPLAATLTPANVADNEEVLRLVPELPEDVRYLLGDVHSNDPTLRARWETDDRLLVTTQRGRYPHTDDGVEVRRLFHQLRSHAIENVNDNSKASSSVTARSPVRASSRHSATSSALSSSTNCSCSTASSTIKTSASASKPACAPHDHL